MNRYLFHVGHLEAGGVGFSASVKATSKRAALATLREALGTEEEGDYPCIELANRIYFNGPIGHFDLYFKLSAISVETIERVEPESPELSGYRAPSAPSQRVPRKKRQRRPPR
jgi:hypothetical protein